MASGQEPAGKCYNSWTEFHRSNMTRLNPVEKVLTVKTVRNLQRKWSYTTGNEVNSSPVVANGVTYVGSDDGYLYALNASTGALLWSFTTGNPGFSSSLARGREWGGLLRFVRRQPDRAERQHRRIPMELHDKDQT